MVHQINLTPARCLACGACELACDWQWRQVHPESAPPPVPRIQLEVAGRQTLVGLCRHCQHPPCLDACPAGAMQREEGRVFVDPHKCIGCWSCVMVCPVGMVAPHAGEAARNAEAAPVPFAFKCDGCPDEPVPPCVRACPTMALTNTDPASGETQARRRRGLALRLLANRGIDFSAVRVRKP